jgi:large subunit ribosomal protein L29
VSKISDLRDRSTPDLQQFQQELARELWKARFGNYTNQLDDTAKIRRHRRTIAQINTLISERTLGLQRTSKVTAPKGDREDREAQTEEAPKKKAKAKAAEVEAADADEAAEETPKKKATKAKPAKATKAKATKKKKAEE